MQTPLLSHNPKSTSMRLMPSPHHLHRNPGVARHILHPHPLKTGEIDLVAGHEVEQLLQRDDTLHAGQRGAQATVDAVTQAQILGSVRSRSISNLSASVNASGGRGWRLR